MFRPPSKKRQQQERENGKASSLATRTTPHYHNTVLEAPDGQPLCVCSIGKAEWYVRQGLGVQGRFGGFSSMSDPLERKVFGATDLCKKQVVLQNNHPFLSPITNIHNSTLTSQAGSTERASELKTTQTAKGEGRPDDRAAELRAVGAPRGRGRRVLPHGQGEQVRCRPRGVTFRTSHGQTSRRCVVCGKEESYLKKYVVPHEYRKYFPGELSLLEFW